MGCGTSAFRPDEDGRVKPVRPRNGETRMTTSPNSNSTTTTTKANPSSTNVVNCKSASSYATPINDVRSFRNSVAQPKDQIDICDEATQKLGEKEGMKRGVVVVVENDGKNVQSQAREAEDVAVAVAVEGEHRHSHSHSRSRSRSRSHSHSHSHSQHEHEQENGRCSDSEGPMFMRSPSFREYCVVYDRQDSVVKDHDNFDGEERENETRKKESIPSLDSNRGLVKGGGRKGRRLRVFPAGKSATVKNLLNVTTCYNTSASSAYNTPGKPAEKAA